jgi:hypothetical protein
LLEGEPRAHARRIASLGAGLLLAGSVAGVGYTLAFRMIVNMARAEFAAIAIIATLFGLALGAVSMFLAVRNLAEWVVLRVQRLPGVRRLVTRTLEATVAVVVVLLALLSAFVFVYREPLSYLPWKAAVQLAGALLLCAFWSFFARRLGRLQPILRQVMGVLLLGALVAAVSLRPGARIARACIEDDSLLGAVGYLAVVRALDLDGDGDIGLFGGEDCAALDPKIHGGAIDLPENGVDEDCDGRDLKKTDLPRRGMTMWPVEGRVPKKPNVVLITIDAFATHHMAFAGGKKGLTRKLDAFAKKSVVFSSCFSQGPSTRLSFPSIFTSRWDTQIHRRIVGHHPFPIEKSEVMIAEVLRQAGYDTRTIISEGYFAPTRWHGLLAGFQKIDTQLLNRRSSHLSKDVRASARAVLSTGT